MKPIRYFLRGPFAGPSINKVTRTISSQVEPRVELVLPSSSSSLWAVLRNLLFVLRNRDTKSVNQIVGGEHYVILGLLGCISVLVVHDTVSLEYRQLPLFKKLLIRYLWYTLPLRFATKVVCISEETRKCVQRYTKRNDILVIHNAVDSAFQRSPLPADHDLPMVLVIGTSENKNLIRTFQALRGLKCQVTVIGQMTDEQITCLRDNHIQYTNRWGLSDEQIVEEYAKCDIVSFISLFEGFGMIVVEANRVGRPVICSDIPVLKEVAADAALFVDPMDVNQMRDGFRQLFADKELRMSLVQKGYANAERFRDDMILSQWKDFYSSL